MVPHQIFIDCMKLLQRVLFVVTASALTIIVVESVLRLFHVEIPLDHERLFDEHSHRVISDRYIFERTDVPPHMTDGFTNIAVIGDSFSECNLIQGVRCYSELIATQSSDMRVYNYAVAGMNTDQEFMYFTDHILPEKPNIVIWQMYSNDVWENVIRPLYTISPGGGQLRDEPAMHNWVYQRQTAYTMLPFRYTLIKSLLVRSILRLFELRRFAQAPGRNDTDRLQWSVDKVRLEVARMNALATQHNFQVIYVLIPPQALYMQESSSSSERVSVDYIISLYRMLDEVLRSQQQYITDVFADYDNSHGAAITALTYYLDDTDTNIRGDKHLNTRGQDVVASRIMNTIHSLKNDMDRIH